MQQEQIQIPQAVITSTILLLAENPTLDVTSVRCFMVFHSCVSGGH
jgi:hypothetical protein